MTLSNGEKISVTLGKNKCRECVVAGWRFMEQNRTKVRSRHRIVSHRPDFRVRKALEERRAPDVDHSSWSRKVGTPCG